LRVIVYVEGLSDKLALAALLRPLIERKSLQGVSIEFFETPTGDRKVSVLTKVPQKAADILLNDLHSIVVAMPDLYPKNKVFPHETAHQLFAGIRKNFDAALSRKIANPPPALAERFRVFCFKADQCPQCFKPFVDFLAGLAGVVQ